MDDSFEKYYGSCCSVFKADVYKSLMQRTVSEPDDIIIKYSSHIDDLFRLLSDHGVTVDDLEQLLIDTVTKEQNRLLKLPDSIGRMTCNYFFTEATYNSIIRKLGNSCYQAIEFSTNQIARSLNIINSYDPDDLTFLATKSTVNPLGLHVKIDFTDDKMIVEKPTILPTDGSVLYVPLKLDIRAKKFRHQMMFIRHCKKWYLFDPNGSNDYHPLWKHIVNDVFGEEVELLTHISFNNTSSLKWNSFDKGLCSVWCILFIHMLHVTKRTPYEIIRFFSNLSNYERGVTVYNYCCGLDDVLK